MGNQELPFDGRHWCITVVLPRKKLMDRLQRLREWLPMSGDLAVASSLLVVPYNYQPLLTNIIKAVSLAIAISWCHEAIVEDQPMKPVLLAVNNMSC